MRFTFLLLLASLGLACSGDDSTSGPSPVGARCIPNQQVSCACPGSSLPGIQLCQTDGASYTTCQCGAGGSSGSSGQSGQGGSGGSSQAGKGGGSGKAGSSGTAGQGGSGGSSAGSGGSSAGSGGSTAGQGGEGQAGSEQAGQGGSSAGAGGAGSGGQSGGGQGGSAGQGGGAGQGGSAGAGGGCGGKPPVEAHPALPALVLVLDRSGSTSDAGRFAAMVDAVSGFLKQVQPQLTLGALRFPEGKFDDSGLSQCIFSQTPECQALWADNGCKDIASPPNVPLAKASTSGPLIDALLAGTTPNGGTPTRWALKSAWSALEKVKASGGRHVVLLSDGAPTVYTPASPPLPEMGTECGTEQQILQEAKAMAEAPDPIFTHAVGMPAEELETGQWLSVLAAASRTAPPGCDAAAASCHHKGPTASAIESALVQIASTASGCRYEIPKGVSAEGLLVQLDTGSGSPVTIAHDPQHTNGWDLDPKQAGVLQIHGPACEKLQQSAQATVLLMPGCAP